MTDVFDQDRRSLQEHRQRAALFDARMSGVVRALSETQDGTDFLRFILDECGVFKAQVPQGQTDAAWREGRRAVGLRVLGFVQDAGVIEKVMKKEVMRNG